MHFLLWLHRGGFKKFIYSRYFLKMENTNNKTYTTCKTTATFKSLLQMIVFSFIVALKFGNWKSKRNPKKWTSIIYIETYKSLQSQKDKLIILVSNFALFVCHKGVCVCFQMLFISKNHFFKKFLTCQYLISWLQPKVEIGLLAWERILINVESGP